MKTLQSNPRRRRRNSGFSMIEVLVATSIAASAFVGVTWSMDMAVRSRSELTQGSLDAALIAGEIHELAVALPKEPSGSVGVTAGGSVAALDSLAGASFSPPIRADGTAIPGASGWTQKVLVRTFALSDLKSGAADLATKSSDFANPASADVTKGLSENSGKLYQLTVMVLKNGEDAGTFSWWITP